MDLPSKYRPKTFDDVIGQESTIKSLKQMLKLNTLPHAILLCSKSPGVGKTTLGRIIASELGCDAHNLIEIDGASNNGIDNMRNLQDIVKHKGIGTNHIRVVIIDEGHRVTKPAWDSVLKIIEEPPQFLYWIICTTDAAALPKTILSRCTKFTLKDMSVSDIVDLLTVVADSEQIMLKPETLRLIATESNGSCRDALVYLNQVRGCTTDDEIRDIIGTVKDEIDVIDLCRMVVNQRAPFLNVLAVLKDLKDTNPYTLKAIMSNYLVSCVLNAKSNKDAVKFLNILQTIDNAKPEFPSILLAVSELFLSSQ